jgi:HEAT repeat protein
MKAIRTAGIILCFALSSARIAASAPPPDVAGLAATLTTGVAQQRYAAADALADLGPAAQPATESLVAALQSDDAELRWRAARALGLIGGAQAVAPLVQRASDPAPVVRAQVIFALGRLHPDGDEGAIAAVVAHLTDPEAPVRRAAVRALAMMKPDRTKMIPMIAKLLEDSDPQVAMRALTTIAESGDQAVPALIAALERPDSRYWACVALSEMGAHAKDAVPGLIKALEDERPQVRLQAEVALGEIGPPAKAAVPALIPLLTDKFEAVRSTAVFALGQIADPSAMEAIRKADQPADAYLHMLVLWALARMNPSDLALTKAAVDQLATKLGAEDRNVSHVAARAITALNPPGEVMRPAMEAVLATADVATADRIFNAFASLGPRIVPLALEALRDPDPRRRERAMRVLSKLGVEAAAAVPDLIAVLRDPNPKLRQEALYVLGAIGPPAASAVPALVIVLTDADPQIQQTAAYALGKIGPAAAAAVPALTQLANSADELVKITAIWALFQMGPPGAELVRTSVPVFMAALASPREIVRIEAAMSLGRLGLSAQTAIPLLEKAAQQDPSPQVRTAAADAVRQIATR